MTDTKDARLIGTKAVRFNVQESARTKTWVTGLALGQLGFALRVTHPFYDNGTLNGDKLLGYIELGSEIGGFDPSALPDEGKTLDIVENGNTRFTRSAFPIKDASGAKVGAVFVRSRPTTRSDGSRGCSNSSTWCS